MTIGMQWRGGMPAAWLVAVLVTVTCANGARALEFDLAGDWSSEYNPFGVWTLWKAPGVPFGICQTDYSQDGTMVRAWADQPFPLQMHVPVWGHGTAGETHVWAHGAEYDRTGSATTSAVWTCPQAGLATISGALWDAGFNRRSMRWHLCRNGTVLSQGDIFSDGTVTEADPFDLSEGSGGPAILVQAVAPGDQLELRLVSLSESGNLGESLCLRLHISLSAATPVPVTAAGRPLLQVRGPNPFNPRTTLRLHATEAGPLRLAVYDAAGRCVRVLFEGDVAAGDSRDIPWNGLDTAGRACATGVYLAHAVGASGVAGARLTLVR